MDSELALHSVISAGERSPEISVVVPAFNECDSITALMNELDSALQAFGRSFEIIAVDDGSTDPSGGVLDGLASTRPHLIVIHLSRNYGQSAAFDAGFRQARGRYIVTMDADGQNDPADIKPMIELLERDHLDFVSGIRRKRQDGFLLRKVPSLIANRLIRIVTHTRIRDLGCSLKVYERSVLKDFNLYGEMHRFLSILIESNGAFAGQLSVNHRPRRHGQSKYGLLRTFKVVLDLLTVWFLRGYSTKPIYVFGGLGIGLFAGSCACSAFVLYQRIVNGIFVHRQPLFIVGLVLAVMSIQFILMGLLAELLIRTYFESRGRPPYLVRSISSKAGIGSPSIACARARTSV